MPNLTRRGFLAAAAAAGAASGASGNLPKICIFSKHLQWANWADAAAVAAEAGYDGVDLTVRAGGHVLPERVAGDLPRAVEAVHKAGLETPMITAGIVDTDSPHAEAILRTASRLGIRYYRWGGLRYTQHKAIEAQLDDLKPRVRDLAALNREHNICAMYHTHSGMEVGAPIWDLWYVLKDFDSQWVGVNYDVGHAHVEGGLGGWIRSAQLTAPMMRGVALKDFRWGRNAKGAWVPEWCPAGEGMVQYTRFFRMLKEARFSGPIQIHFEYDGLGGADEGKPRLGIPKTRFLAAIRRDLEYVRARMREAGLTADSTGS